EAPARTDRQRGVGADEALTTAGEAAEHTALSAAGECPAEEESVDVVDDERRGARRRRDVARLIAECRQVHRDVVGVVETGREPEANLIAAAPQPAQFAA